MTSSTIRSHPVPLGCGGLRNRYDTDGYIVPVVEQLIEIGIAWLAPIQQGTVDMHTENLRDLLTGRISFYCGTGRQHQRLFGTAERIE